MYFESIPDTLRVFDIIESRKDGNCFNVLNVSLDLSNERANYIAKYLRDNIPYMLWQFFLILLENILLMNFLSGIVKR